MRFAYAHVGGPLRRSSAQRAPHRARPPGAAEGVGGRTARPSHWVAIAHFAVAAPQEDPRRRRCPCQLLRQGAAALPGGLRAAWASRIVVALVLLAIVDTMSSPAAAQLAREVPAKELRSGERFPGLDRLLGEPLAAQSASWRPMPTSR